MATTRPLERPLTDEVSVASAGGPTWWSRPVLKKCLMSAVMMAITLAGLHIMAPPSTSTFSPESLKVLPNLSASVREVLEAPRFMNESDATEDFTRSSLHDLGNFASLQQVLKEFPRLLTVRDANDLLERLPPHDDEDLVCEHIMCRSEDLFADYLHHQGSCAPHWKTGERRLSHRYKLDDAEEFNYRLSVFRSNIRSIVGHNNMAAKLDSGPDRAVFSLNKFADWTWSELQTILMGPVAKNATDARPSFLDEEEENIEDEEEEHGEKRGMRVQAKMDSEPVAGHAPDVGLSFTKYQPGRGTEIPSNIMDMELMDEAAQSSRASFPPPGVGIEYRDQFLPSLGDVLPFSKSGRYHIALSKSTRVLYGCEWVGAKKDKCVPSCCAGMAASKTDNVLTGLPRDAAGGAPWAFQRDGDHYRIVNFYLGTQLIAVPPSRNSGWGVACKSVHAAVNEAAARWAIIEQTGGFVIMNTWPMQALYLSVGSKGSTGLGLKSFTHQDMFYWDIFPEPGDPRSFPGLISSGVFIDAYVTDPGSVWLDQKHLYATPFSNGEWQVGLKPDSNPDWASEVWQFIKVPTPTGDEEAELSGRDVLIFNKHSHRFLYADDKLETGVGAYKGPLSGVRWQSLIWEIVDELLPHGAYGPQIVNKLTRDMLNFKGGVWRGGLGVLPQGRIAYRHRAHACFMPLDRARKHENVQLIEECQATCDLDPNCASVSYNSLSRTCFKAGFQETYKMVSGQHCRSAVSYTLARSGYCNMPSWLQVYDGSDNPGTDNASRVHECALACAQQLQPKTGTWTFSADTFSVSVSGRCYCGLKALCNFVNDYVHYHTYDLPLPQGAAYKTFDEEYCPSGQDITDEFGCKSAASQLGFFFAGSWYGPRDHRYCFFANDGRSKVYFNKAGSAAGDHPRENFASICLDSPQLARGANYTRTPGACRILGILKRGCDEVKVCGDYTKASCERLCDEKPNCSGFILALKSRCCYTFTTTQPVWGTVDRLDYDCYVNQRNQGHVATPLKYTKTRGSCRIAGELSWKVDSKITCPGSLTACQALCDRNQMCTGLTMMKGSRCCFPHTNVEPVWGTTQALQWDCYVNQRSQPVWHLYEKPLTYTKTPGECRIEGELARGVDEFHHGLVYTKESCQRLCDEQPTCSGYMLSDSLPGRIGCDTFTIVQPVWGTIQHLKKTDCYVNERNQPQAQLNYTQTRGACAIKGQAFSFNWTGHGVGGWTWVKCQTTCDRTPQCSGFTLHKSGSSCITFSTVEPVWGYSPQAGWYCYVNQRNSDFRRQSNLVSAQIFWSYTMTYGVCRMQGEASRLPHRTKVCFPSEKFCWRTKCRTKELCQKRCDQDAKCSGFTLEVYDDEFDGDCCYPLTDIEPVWGAPPGSGQLYKCYVNQRNQAHASTTRLSQIATVKNFNQNSLWQIKFGRFPGCCRHLSEARRREAWNSRKDSNYYIDYREGAPSGLLAARDQSGGTCYAYTAAATLRHTAWVNMGRDPGALSVQYSMDCNGVRDPCNGGDILQVYDTATSKGGWANVKDYGGQRGHCHQSKCKAGIPLAVKLSGRTDLGGEHNMAKALVTRGPITASIYASGAFYYYSKGILRRKQCPPNEVNHAVVAVGKLGPFNMYGRENDYRNIDIDAWLLRNSWGSDWGEKGYIRLAYGEDACHISIQGAFPHNARPGTTCSGGLCPGDVRAYAIGPKTKPSSYLSCHMSTRGACYMGKSRMKWIVKANGDGSFNLDGLNKGWYLDAYEDDGHHYGAVANRHQSDGSQNWIIKAVGDGSYTLQQKDSRRYLTLAIGTQVSTISTKSASELQHWIFTGVVPSPTSPISGGHTYVIQPKSSFVSYLACRRAYRGACYMSTGIITWTVKAMGGDSFNLEELGSGWYLDAYEDDGHHYGAVANRHQSDGSQNWIIKAVGDGSYTLQQKNTRRYLTLGIATPKVSTIDTKSFSEAQQWIFTKYS